MRTSASQFGSITVVDRLSAMIAGPEIWSPGWSDPSFEERYFAELVVEVGGCRCILGWPANRRLLAWRQCCGGAADDFDARGDDFERPIAVRVAVSLCVCGGEGGREVVVVWPVDGEVAFDALVAKIQRASGDDVFGSDAFAMDFVGGFMLHRVEALSCEIERRRIERPFDAGGAMARDVCQSDADGAQDAGVGMDEYFSDSQFTCDGAGMLRRGRAERDEDVVGRVCAFGDGHESDRRRHVGVGDAEQAGGEFVRRVFRANGAGHFGGE